MGRQRHTPEQIIGKLREAEDLQGKVADLSIDNAILKEVSKGKF